MGFWDAIGKVAKAGMNQVNEYNQETQAKIEEFQSKSDEELRQIMKSGWSSNADKTAAAKVLKSRGY